MVEHIKEVLIEVARTDNFKLITEKLSFEERKYLVAPAEDIFAYEEDKKVVDKLEDNYDLFISNLFTSDERTNLIENIETCSEGMQDFLTQNMPLNKALEYLDKVNKNVRGYIVRRLPPEEAIKYFDKINNGIIGEIVEKLPPEEAIKYFDFLNLHSKAEVVSKLKRPIDKIKYLDESFLESEKENILSSINVAEVLETDEEKIRYFDRLPLSQKYAVSLSFKEPINKIKYLDERFTESQKENILSSINVAEVLETDEKKIRYFDRLPLSQKYAVSLSFRKPINKIMYLVERFTEYEKENILSSINVAEVLETDEEKIRYFDRLPLSQKYTVSLSFKEPVNKIKYLDERFTESQRENILSGINVAEVLETDEEKIKYLNKLPFQVQKQIVIEFSNEKRIKCIDKVPEELKTWIIAHFDNPKTKLEYLDRVSIEQNKNIILDSIKDLMTEILKTDEEKKKYFSLLSDKYKTEIILSFSNDEDKIKYLETVSGNYRTRIIASIEKLNNFSLNTISFAINKYPTATIDEYAKILPIIDKIVNSNSLELSAFASQFCDLIVQSQDPNAMITKIESIFLRNNIPMFGKIFLSFQAIYPDFQKDGNFDFSSDSRVSPELLNPIQSKEMNIVSRLTNGNNFSLKDIRFQIIFNDLLRIAGGSNNRSLLEYLNNIEIGNKLFLGLQQGIIEFDRLDKETKNILEVFSNHLQVLYENFPNVSVSKLTQELAKLSLEEKIAYLSKKFVPNNKYDLPDRIVRSFCYQAGVKSFEQLKTMVITSVREKEQINRKSARALENGQTVKLKQGDFVRAIGSIDAIGSSLDNGNVCRELLVSFNGTSESDSTPLDIDLSIITKDNSTIYENIQNSPTGFNFGNIYIILNGDNPNINITRNSEGILTGKKYDSSKIEMFGTKTAKGGYETHWGARTGIASTDIDYILYKRYGVISSMPYDENGNVKYLEEENKDDIHELSLLKMEIVKNGFYIPVIDFSGKLIFTPEEFDKLKGKLNGLSYYEIKKQWELDNTESRTYHIAEHSSNAMIENIKKSLSISKAQTDNQSSIITSYLASIIENIDTPFGEKMKYKSGISGELTTGTIEVISTGSTSRNTNIPGDYDFDYIFRIDTVIYKDPTKMANLCNQILNSLGIEESEKNKYILNGNIREVPLTLQDGRVIPLDITFVRKTDKVKYSTDMALEDRMANISKNSAVADEVKANIILAKMLLKAAGCYKPARKDKEQGGLGGVGIENWILQNGGSLESAAESFLEAAKQAKQSAIESNDEEKEYLEFLRRYQVYDFGANHLSEEKQEENKYRMRKELLFYSYDEFVYTNMNSIGYKKMCHILEQYLKFVKGDKQVLEQPEFKSILSKIEQFYIMSQEMLRRHQEESISYEDRGGRGSRGQITFLFLMAISFILSIITIIVGMISYK